MKSALIIGASGNIGSALANKLEAASIQVKGTCHVGTPPYLKLDLNESGHWPELPRSDVAYLCAAITKLEACEHDPKTSHHINVTQMQALASRLLAQGVFVVFLSSNQVFDGNKPMREASDTPCPINEYGRQKAEFESWLLAQSNCAVLRLTKVVDGGLPILRTWESQLLAGNDVEAFEDLVSAPISLPNVLAALTHIGTSRETGIHQLSGDRDISYFEIAQMLAEKLGIGKKHVTAISAKAKGIPANFLPHYGSLLPTGSFAAENVETVLFRT